VKYALRGLAIALGLLLIGLLTQGRKSHSPSKPLPDPWTHVLGRVTRGGASNSEGPYAASYTRVYKAPSGAEKTVLLVDAPARELELADALISKGLVREASFHFRNIANYYPDTPEAAQARSRLEACRSKSAIEWIEPLGTIFTDENRLLAAVSLDRAGLSHEDLRDLGGKDGEAVVSRRGDSPVAFSILYGLAQSSKGEEAARLYKEALKLAHVPALPIIRFSETTLYRAGFVDDARTVIASPADDFGKPAIFFPDATINGVLAGRLFLEVKPGNLYDCEKEYKTRFLKDAAAVLGQTPEIERAQAYWGLASPEAAARYAQPPEELDLAYDHAAAAAPHLKITTASMVTTAPELALKLDWANLGDIRFQFSTLPVDLPTTETGLKQRLEELRRAPLPIAYEETRAPESEIRLPIRKGSWRVVAQAEGLRCTFFAVRMDLRLEALIFPTETVLLTNTPGLAVGGPSQVMGREKDGAIRLPVWQAKYCSSHASCCSTCESCAHHHGEETVALAGPVQLFGCDGRVFFRAKAAPDFRDVSTVKAPVAGPVLTVYADRPVYRAGDTLHFRGLYRTPHRCIERGMESRYQVLPNETVTVSILRDKETLFIRRYVTGEFGTFSGEFALPLSTARAEYALKVDHATVSAVGTFEVIDYRKSDFVITLESRRGGVHARAGYAWGAPVEGAAIKAFVKGVETPMKGPLVPAPDGEEVRVTLVRGGEDLASKTVVHREPSAPLSTPEPEVAREAPPPPSTAPTAKSDPSLKSPPTGPTIRASKSVYGRGETIEIEVTGPDGEALVVLGDVQAYDWQRIAIQGGRGVARFPAGPILDPGVTAFAVVGGTIVKRAIDVQGQRMTVQVVPDRPSAAPGDEVGITVRALPGAELSLAAVDEAIFMIREDATPELYGSHYPSRPAAMAYASFGEFSYDGETQLAESLPQDPHLKSARRVYGNIVIPERGVYDAMGIGGGGGGGGRYGGRFGGRENLVARGGGTRATESAVLSNLRRLSERQQPDGSWGAGEVATEFGAMNEVGITSVILLSYLGAGYSHLSKDAYGGICFGDVVKDGLKFLMSRQGSDGCIGEKKADYLVNHALAATAISEAYGMSATLLFKSPATSAIAFLASRQAGDGGWSPSGGDTGESPVSGLAVMALKSAQLSELDYSTRAATNASRFFQALTRNDGTCPTSHRPGAKVTRLTTASAMISFIFLNRDKKEPKLAGVRTLLNDLPSSSRVDYCGWYMAALAIFQYDGPDGPNWKRWNDPMKAALIELQRDGLWASPGTVAETHCMTGFAGLTLEVYYRYANYFGATRGEGGAPRLPAEDAPLVPVPAIRVYFPDTALWIPSMVADAKGEARTTLLMPDSITTIRLTSRGVTRDTALGEGVGRIESRQPFFINLKSPAFFVAGDEAEIRAEIFNYTGAAIDDEVALSGDGFTLAEAAKRRVRVGESCESVSWRVRIADVSSLRFLVQSSRDAVEKRVPVKAVAPPSIRNFRGPVVTVPERETAVDLVLRVTPKGSPLSKVLEALRYLNEYPHG